jgi:FkbH-like protein
MEPVRLIIWDLDGVFWHGTLAEEGAVARPENVQHVIALAKRGIMSAVCSKNDFSRAQAELQAQGAWDYLIFPSIDLTPKGARIAQLVAAVQLRPETILFIDDQPANLAEARAAVPGLQVAGPEIIPYLAHHPLLQGKPDPELTRLAHYRLLQQRQSGVARTGGDNLAFLRASNIRLRVEYDVEAHLDRAIELINRTNQLNFTKSRLPENIEEARGKLREALSRFDVFAGLVRVVDDYGDYGIVGFYCGSIWYGARTLTHFCFSCRIMNMGIEAYIYQRIGSPALKIVGDVAGDPFAPGPFDWITVLEDEAQAQTAAPARLADRLILRGGCDLQALAHYLAPRAGAVEEEFNLRRNGRPYRIDHCLLLPHVFSPPEGETRAAMEAIGYRQSDWTSALATPRPEERQVWIFSFWTDDFAQLYKHQRLDLTLPFLAEGDPRATHDLTRFSAEDMRGIMTQDENFAAWQALMQNFWCVGPLFDDLARPAIERMMAAAVAQDAFVIIILAPESWCYKADALPITRHRAARVNEWLRAAAPAAVFVNMQDFTAPDTAYPDMLHYDRLVYQRAATHIAELMAARFGG